MKELIDFLLRFANLNQQQIELISRKSAELNLRQGEHYWEAGKMVKQVGFITEGVVRVYYYTNTGQEHTRYFIDENHLILGGPTNDGNYVPSEYIQAITDSKFIVFSKKDWKELSDTIIDWDQVVQKINNKQHAEKLQRRSPLVSQDASTRYLEFIDQFPTLINRIPLSYVASYLGITQSSLSRIRKNINR